ncbi:hypothetical protein B0H13DRAFT_1894695 [Mycena leptocephala]|nr:hypothetical protein B0H13DRAFT_1894695 [Mycena leptocephala]
MLTRYLRVSLFLFPYLGGLLTNSRQRLHASSTSFCCAAQSLCLNLRKSTPRSRFHSDATRAPTLPIWRLRECRKLPGALSGNVVPLRLSSCYPTNHLIDLSALSILRTWAHPNSNSPSFVLSASTPLLAPNRLYSHPLSSPQSPPPRIIHLIGLSIHLNSTRFSGIHVDTSPRSFHARTETRRAETELLRARVPAARVVIVCTGAPPGPPASVPASLTDSWSGAFLASLVSYDLATTGTRTPAYLRRRHQRALAHFARLSMKVDGYGGARVDGDGAHMHLDGGERDGDEDGHRALAHLSGDVNAVGDGNEEAQVRLQCRYRFARERGGRRRRWRRLRRPVCACRRVLRMRMETEVRRRVWTNVLPIALALALALYPVPPSSCFSFIFKAPRYCMGTQERRARWTSSVRNVDVEVGAYVRHPPRRLSAPSSCECGLRMQRNACVLAHRYLEMTRCRRARSRVNGGGDGWGMRVRVLAGAAFAPPLLCVYAHTNPMDGRRAVSHWVNEYTAPSKLTPRASAARANDVVLLPWQALRPLFSFDSIGSVFLGAMYLCLAPRPGYAPSSSFCTTVPLSPAYLSTPYRVFVPVPSTCTTIEAGLVSASSL